MFSNPARRSRITASETIADRFRIAIERVHAFANPVERVLAHVRRQETRERGCQRCGHGIARARRRDVQHRACGYPEHAAAAAADVWSLSALHSEVDGLSRSADFVACVRRAVPEGEKHLAVRGDVGTGFRVFAIASIARSFDLVFGCAVEQRQPNDADRALEQAAEFVEHLGRGEVLFVPILRQRQDRDQPHVRAKGDAGSESIGTFGERRQQYERRRRIPLLQIGNRGRENGFQTSDVLGTHISMSGDADDERERTVGQRSTSASLPVWLATAFLWPAVEALAAVPRLPVELPAFRSLSRTPRDA